LATLQIAGMTQLRPVASQYRYLPACFMEPFHVKFARADA
jgi:hypothetical protein